MFLMDSENAVIYYINSCYEGYFNTIYMLSHLAQNTLWWLIFHL